MQQYVSDGVVEFKLACLYINQFTGSSRLTVISGNMLLEFVSCLVLKLFFVLAESL